MYEFGDKSSGCVLMRGRDKVKREMGGREFLYALGWAWTSRTYRVEPGVAGSNVMISGFCFCKPCGLLELGWSPELDTGSHCCSFLLKFFGRVIVADRGGLIQRIMRVHGRGPIFINVDIEFRINAFS